MICYTEIRQEDVLMNEEQYYEEIEHLIKKNEIQKQVRRLEENNTLVTTFGISGKF